MAKTGQIKEHLIRQKEGFTLKGFTLRDCENREKSSTLLLIRVSQVRDLYGLPRSEDRSLPRGFQTNQGVKTLGQPTPWFYCFYSKISNSFISTKYSFLGRGWAWTSDPLRVSCAPSLFSTVFKANQLFCTCPYFSLKNLFFNLHWKTLVPN